jgi:hypothetical protein
MADGYGSHFTCNVLATDIFAAGTAWAMSTDAWTVMVGGALFKSDGHLNTLALQSGYLLDGAQWANRGPNWHVATVPSTPPLLTYLSVSTGMGQPVAAISRTLPAQMASA